MSKKRISFSTKPSLPPSPDQWVSNHGEAIISQPITEATVADTIEEFEVVEDTQERRLSDLETIIKDNLEGFYKVGMALKEIRDSKLYKEVLGYNRFEDYCADRWDMSKTYALRLESAAKTVDIIKSGLEIEQNSIIVLPKTESQVRPLNGLEAEEQIAVWQQVINEAPIEEKTGEPKITAKLVQDTLAKIHGNTIIPKVPVKKIPLSDDMENSLGNILYKFSKQYNTKVKQQEIIFACIEMINDALEKEETDNPVIQSLLNKLQQA